MSRDAILSGHNNKNTVDLTKFILKTTLDNTNKEQKTGDRNFQTIDSIFFDSYDEVKGLKSSDRLVYATDYAVMNGALLYGSHQGYKDKQLTWSWLRSAYSRNYVYGIYEDGNLNNYDVNRRSAGLCPALHLNLSSIISARSDLGDFKIRKGKDTKGKVIYHTIDFGEFPKTYVGNSLNDELEKRIPTLRKTGKTYSGYYESRGNLTQNEEYEYKGERYVRVKTQKYDEDSEYSDGTKAPENETFMWVKVEPIAWRIRNWDDMPKEINPRGNGKASYIDVRSEEGIISGIPFSTSYGNTKNAMWQNSIPRAYFNGYDLHAEIDSGNGNKKYKDSNNFSFSSNFLSEAFDVSIEKVHSSVVIKSPKASNRTELTPENESERLDKIGIKIDDEDYPAAEF